MVNLRLGWQWAGLLEAARVFTWQAIVLTNAGLFFLWVCLSVVWIIVRSLSMLPLLISIFGTLQFVVCRETGMAVRCLMGTETVYRPPR